MESQKSISTRQYIWSELRAGRAVTHLSVLRAIGSIKCQQRIFELREHLRKINAPQEIVTTMKRSANGRPYASYTLRDIPTETTYKN